MIYNKPRKVNVERMKRHQQRAPNYRQCYQIQIDRDVILDFPEDFYKSHIADIRRDVFDIPLRRRHMWDGKVYEIITFEDFDIDFNRHRVIFEERIIPNAWRRRYTHLTVSKYGFTR